MKPFPAACWEDSVCVCVCVCVSPVLTAVCVLRSKRSEREVRAAGQVLQLVWGHKELRRPLEKDGWKKADFAVNLSGVNGSTNGGRANGSYDDGTLPLLDRGVCVCVCVCVL
jgi:hypothetical protein